MGRRNEGVYKSDGVFPESSDTVLVVGSSEIDGGNCFPFWEEELEVSHDPIGLWREFPF